MTQPLHRSRGFWLGLAGLGLLCGMWVHSMRWSMYGGVQSRDGVVSLHHEPGLVRFEIRTFGDLHRSSSIHPWGEFGRYDAEMEFPWMPMPFVRPYREKGLYDPFENVLRLGDRVFEVGVPHWLLIALYLPLAWLLIKWRERVRQRAGAAISPA